MILAMKILLITLLTVVLSGVSVMAQDRGNAADIVDPPRTVVPYAVLAGIGIGVAAHDNSSFSDRLQSWSPVGEGGKEMVYRTGRFSGTGFTLNAGIGALFAEKFMVGASGELLSFPVVEAITTNNERSEYDLSGSGGQLELGWAVVNNHGTLVWPYISLGYYGYSLEFKNNQSDSIPFFEGEPVAAGQTATYSGSSFRPGIGVGLTRFIGGGTEGAVVSARLGWGTFLSHPEWENESGATVNNGGKTPCYSGVSLSVTIGGGLGWF